MLYIGIMSGTSLDGADAALCAFPGRKVQVLGFCSAPLPDALRTELLALNHSGFDELHRAALASNALARVYAELVQTLLHQCKVTKEEVRAVGAHGQTVRHRPQEFDATGYTLQLNQPALLAELCGIDVVADFRSRDVAAGGQGAPLVAPFHQAVFGQALRRTAVLNLGGISNITLLDPFATPNVRAFDCGPGNALLDAWCKQHTGAPYDASGNWAASGQVNMPLLAALLREPYFAKTPPKSTGRDLFNLAWLIQHLHAFDLLTATDVQATLTQLTALTCAQCVPPGYESVIVCGGGAFNKHLMSRLQSALPQCHVNDSSDHGLPPLQVEASAFAWLASQAIERQPASLAEVTGATGERILGAIYPA